MQAVSGDPGGGNHEDMRTALALSATALLVAGLTGCGDEAPTAGGPEPSSPGSSTTIDPPTQPTPSTGTGTAGFPLTVTRRGGIIGFNDSLVIGPDGSVTMSVRDRSGRCKVDPTLLSTITAAVKDIDWRTLPGKPPTPRFPDDLVIAVGSQGGSTRLDDPRVKSLSQPLNTLLSDADAAPAARKHCT